MLSFISSSFSNISTSATGTGYTPQENFKVAVISCGFHCVPIQMGRTMNGNISSSMLCQSCVGCYPHASVPPCPGVIPVQTEVVYCPQLRFIAYDIAVTKAQGRGMYQALS